MVNHKIIICQGIQGSGKTTWAKNWVAEEPEKRVRFNYDDIRNMMGPYWVPKREVLLKPILLAFLNNVMESGFDAVIDNMNLSSSEINLLKRVILGKKRWCCCHYEIIFKTFPTPLEVCIERDSKRERPIGEEIIRSTYERHLPTISKMCKE